MKGKEKQIDDTLHKCLWENKHRRVLCNLFMSKKSDYRKEQKEYLNEI